MKELKSCPFCGRKPTVENCKDFGYFVKCKCGIEQSTLYAQRCDAVKRWNKRKPEPQTMRDENYVYAYDKEQCEWSPIRKVEDEPQTPMTEDDAFYIVFKDLTKDEGVFTGRYDAKNGSENYMYGVCSVMECIAYKVGEDCYDAFTDRFTKNMIESKEKAERSKK